MLIREREQQFGIDGIGHSLSYLESGTCLPRSLNIIMTGKRLFIAQIGDRHGTRTIIDVEDKSANGRSYVSVRCDCGAEKRVDYSNLRYGQGCAFCLKNQIYQPEQYIGQTFGKRTVMAIYRDKGIWADAQCECGERKSVMLVALLKGRQVKCQSCAGPAHSACLKHHPENIARGEIREARQAKVRQWRDVGGFTNAEIAKLLNVSEPHASAIYLGKR